MPNPLLPRAQVHAWSDEIGQNQDAHALAIQRLVREQRRLSKFVEENAENFEPMTGGIGLYLIGVVLRMFDLAGGRMRSVTWDDVRAAEKRVKEQVERLFPVDAGLPERARAVPRAQGHVLDEALYALFERPPGEGEERLNDHESFKIYLLMWVATEALDASWTPPTGFQGEAEYTFTPVE